VNVVGGYDPELLQGCPRIEAGPMPPRAGNVTLGSSKLTEDLGFAPFDSWPLDDRLTPSDLDWHRSQSQFSGSADHVRELLYRHPQRDGKVPPSREEISRPTHRRQ